MASATKLQTARTISLSGDVSGSASFDGTSNITISTTVANDSHSHSNIESIRSLYSGAGGVHPPNWIGTNQLKCAMMYSNPPGNTPDVGYCDWIIMNAYSWNDVPYSTAIGVLKTAGSPRAWIMSGNNSSQNSGWRRRELAYADQLPSFSYSDGVLTITT